ncbi:MAG: hypothetical protein RSE94_01525 [Pseudomonas sp.]
MTNQTSAQTAQDLPSTQLFSSPLSMLKNTVMPSTTAEHIFQCLRLAQLQANTQYSREKHAKQWFSSVLETLEALGFKLFEHTQRHIPYSPTQEVLKDVFDGWLPAPQAKNLRFKAVTKEVINSLHANHQEQYRHYSTSTHLNVTLDSDDGETFVAILFHVLCTQAPNAPKTQLILELDHLGAEFSAAAFATHSDQIDARIKVLANLDQFLA